MLFARTLTTFLLLLISVSAFASMELNNVIFHFEPGEPSREDVEIFNPSNAPLYVQIEPKEVLEAGSVEEERRLIQDPREAGLLVTPNKLVIPPGATKVVRMVKLGAYDKERVYRIGAKPIVDGIESETSGLKILVGYEILAIAYPSEADPNLNVRRNGKKLIFENAGNANVLLREGYQCANPNMDKEECTALPGKRLYPGNIWELDLPEDLPVRYYQSVGTRHFVETYP